MRPLLRFLPSAPPAPAYRLVRGDVFFVRRVGLSADEPADGQVSLAIEGLAPFPPEQLYFGHVLAADGRAALVFAAYRRRFDEVETQEWAAAEVVTAEFAPLLAVRPDGDGVVVHTGAQRVTALAWKAGEDLPLAVVVKAGGEENAAVAEARAKAGLDGKCGLVKLAGELGLKPDGEAGWRALAEGEPCGSVLAAARLGGADVRAPEFLAERSRARKRDEWLWRGLLGAAAVLALAALMDLGTGLWSWGVGRQEAKVAAQKDVVAQTETAQALANRIAELNEKRLMPFEMLSVVNPARPDSVIFQRVVTRGLLGLEVEAQATNAEDVGAYANALKALPALAAVRTRVDGARDGVTRFVLSLDFKAEALRNGGGK